VCSPVGVLNSIQTVLDVRMLCVNVDFNALIDSCRN
jgi:hypothetical protein